MSFLKLSNLLINTSKIVSIETSSSKYKINMSNWLFHGGIWNCKHKLFIYKSINPDDYKIVEDFKLTFISA